MQTAKCLGERLKISRKSAGYSQKEVGALLGMAQQNYARYEAGLVELNYDKIVFLCRLYRVSADYLLGLDDYGAPIENGDEKL